MFKNYIKIAWRSLKRQPFFAFLNTFGLAIGMAGGLLISLYIYDEFSYDTMWADVDRIHRVNADIKFGGTEMNSAQTPAPMAAAMQRDFPQIESTVRIRARGSALIRKTSEETNSKELQVAYADSTMFSFFGIELIAGDAQTALSKPKTLVLTKTAAKKHFRDQNAVGQMVVLNNDVTYTVSGIIEDLPKNSLLRGYSIFMAMSGHPASHDDNWGGNNFYTFIKLVPKTNISDLKEPLIGMLERYMLPWAQQYFPGITGESFEAAGNYIKYHTIELKKIHLHSNRDAELNANNSIQNIYILAFIALFLIVLACVNFMNLSTANSLKRTKEVGVRKTLGSNKVHLVQQFLIESGLISFFSLVLALVLTIIVLPYFNLLSDKAIVFPYQEPLFWVGIILTTIVLGFISGSYPAFFMSRFNAVLSLQGGQTVAGGGKIRNSLVVFQFAVSVFLIIATLVVFQQLNFIQAKDLGFQKDKVVIINDTYGAGNQIQAFKTELLSLSQVKHVTISGYLPTPSNRGNTSVFREGLMAQEDVIQMNNWDVDHDYIKTLDMEVIAGRDFDKSFPNDSTAMIINAATLPILGVTAEEAIGMRLTEDADLEVPSFYTVVGVIKNFHYESLKDEIGALGLMIDKSTTSMAIKLKAGDYTSTLKDIERVWTKMAPGQPFSYEFMDASFNNTYKAEQRLSKIFIIFTILSILIACLGLFGLAAFNAQKRTKEIGVRKVLGASVSQISYQLTMDFLKLVVIGVLLALPIGWYAMNKWLEDFSYRIEIGWGVFIFAAIIAIVIAILTVSYQSIKAAIVNPVTSLRSE